LILRPSIDEDLPQITAWQGCDKWHEHNESPNWWLTGLDSNLSVLFTTRVDDEEGTLAYVRIDEEGDGAYRLWTIFSPDVPTKRMAVGIVEFLKMLKMLATDNHRSIRTQTKNPKLQTFLMAGLGFKEAGDQLEWGNFGYVTLRQGDGLHSL
jgi:hypothetical protein